PWREFYCQVLNKVFPRRTKLLRRSMALGEEGTDRLECAIQCVIVDVEMGDPALLAIAPGQPDAARLQELREALTGVFVAVDEDDICVRHGHLERGMRRQAFGQSSGAAMVFGKTVDIVLDR